MAEGAQPSGPVKLVILPRTKTGLGRAGLRQHLERVHGPLVMSHPEVSGKFRSYVHCYTQDDAPVGIALLEDRDDVTIIRLANFPDLIASKASKAYREVVSPDEDNFREIEGSIGMATTERIVRPGCDSAARKVFVFRQVADVSEPMLEEWAARLASFAAPTSGLIVNFGKVAEGEFSWPQFDEIGVAPHADVAHVLAELAPLAEAQFGAVDTRILVTEPVIFVKPESHL